VVGAELLPKKEVEIRSNEKSAGLLWYYKEINNVIKWVVFSKCGSNLVFGTANGSVVVLDIKSRAILHTYNNIPIKNLAISSNGFITIQSENEIGNL